MQDFAKWVVAATVGASALPCIGVGAAAAADVAVPYSQPRYSQPQPAPPEYYPPAEEVYREAPPAYVYAEPPPPVYRYYDGPPVIAVVPPPLYGRPYYGPRWQGPHIARGPYGHPYGSPWAYRRW